MFVGKTTSERFGFKAKANSTTETEEEINAPQVVGSTISSDHAQEYQPIKPKAFYNNIADMLFLNAYNTEFGYKK